MATDTSVRLDSTNGSYTNPIKITRGDMASNRSTSSTRNSTLGRTTQPPIIINETVPEVVSVRTTRSPSSIKVIPAPVAPTVDTSKSYSPNMSPVRTYNITPPRSNVDILPTPFPVVEENPLYWTPGQEMPNNVAKVSMAPQMAGEPSLEEQLTAMGFYPLEFYQPDAEAPAQVKCLNKTGNKCFIMMDTPNYPQPTKIAKISIKKAEITETKVEVEPVFHQTCNTCNNKWMCGVAYQRGGVMCNLQPEQMSYKETMFTEVDIKSDPTGLFAGDTAPAPILRWSQMNNDCNQIHGEINKAYKEMVKCILHKKMEEVEDSRRQLRCLDQAIYEYQQVFKNKAHHLKSVLHRLECIDKEYDCIDMCRVCNPEEIICKHSQLWDNIVHRQLLWGHLVESVSNVASIDCLLKDLVKNVEMEKDQLCCKFKNLDACINFSYNQ